MTAPQCNEKVTKDCEELRDIAQWFDESGREENGEFLRALATRYAALSAQLEPAIQRAMLNLLDAVEGVLQFDWVDNDEDAAEAIERLRKAARDLGVVQRLAQEESA